MGLEILRPAKGGDAQAREQWDTFRQRFPDGGKPEMEYGFAQEASAKWLLSHGVWTLFEV